MNESSPVSVQLPSIGSLLKESWAVYAKNFWRYILIVLAPAVLVIIFGLITMPILMLSGGSVNLETKIVPMIILSVVGVIVLCFASAWGYSALLTAIKGHIRNETVSFQSAYKLGWKKILPFIWVMILSTLITFGASIFLIIPGIIVSVWFIFGMHVVIDSESRGLSALFQSKHLVSGNWWNVIGRIAVMGIISMVIIMVIQAITNQAISQAVTTLFITPFSLVYSWTLYEKMKTLKPGTASSNKRVWYILLAIIGIFAITAAIVVPVLAARKLVQNGIPTMGMPAPGVNPDDIEEMIVELQSQGKLPANFEWDPNTMPNDGRVY